MVSTPRRADDWLLIHAWIEPQHARPLRIEMRRRSSDGPPPERASAPFVEIEDALTFVGDWLDDLLRRGSTNNDQPGR